MSSAKARVSGAWVDTPLAGSARLAGESIPFGPAASGAVNLMRNPSMKYFDSGWVAGGTFARVTDLVGTPRNTGVITTADGYTRSATAPVTPGSQYMVSFYGVNRTDGFKFGRSVYFGYTRSTGGDDFPEAYSHAMGEVDEVSRFSQLSAPAPANATGLYVLWDSLWIGSVMTCVMVDPSGALNDYTERDSSLSLFTSETPVILDAADGTDNYSLATYMSASVPGTVTAIRWWFPATAQPGGQAVKARAFDLATSLPLCPETSFATPGTLGAWNEVSITPFHVDAGQTFVPAIWTPLRYVSASGVASPWPLTNGVLSTPSGAGRFTGGASGNVELPASSFNNGCYFVDVVFEED